MKKVINYLFVFAIALWSLGPFIWQWATSFKEPGLVSQLPPVWPAYFNMENYLAVLDNKSFLKVILNSVVVSLGATGIALAIGSLAAFGISRVMQRGRNLVLFFLLIVFMVPQVALVTPFYKLMVASNLKDTLLGLILVYSVFTVPLVVWIMHQVFEEIPESLYHAARVDGCTLWKTFCKIYLPLGTSGMVSAGLLSLIFCWNEFLFALTFTSSFQSRTIPVGITLFSSQYDFPWGEISAASTLVTLPIVLTVAFAQKYLIRGLIGSSLKG